MALQLRGKRLAVTSGVDSIGPAVAGQFAAERCAVGTGGRTAFPLDVALEQPGGHGRTSLAHVGDIADATIIGPWLNTVGACAALRTPVRRLPSGSSPWACEPSRSASVPVLAAVHTLPR